MKLFHSFPLRAFAAFFVLSMASFVASAQSVRDDFMNDPLRVGSNYYAYPAPSENLSPAPKGYEPFYISHYGRHGSRWLTDNGQYTCVLDVLRTADRRGKLTPDGKEVLNQLEVFFAAADGRAGDLSPLGERQHHQIGRRFTQHFPQVFEGDAQIDAFSSVIQRCIISMVAECEEFCAFNPKVKIHNDVSQRFQYYLNGYYSASKPAIWEVYKKMWTFEDDYAQKWLQPSRFCMTIFTDVEYVQNCIGAIKFMRDFFNMAANMQSHDNAPDFLRFFTPDECYNLWRIRNIGHYLHHTEAQQSDGVEILTQTDLVYDILHKADSVLQLANYHGATLRFGHEVNLMPLACVFELSSPQGWSCNPKVENLDTLDNVWADYRIFPMAGNFQMVFYRPVKGNGDVLVKFLLNEEEMRLPLSTSQWPYYKWSDVRSYYYQRLDKMVERKKSL